MDIVIALLASCILLMIILVVLIVVMAMGQTERVSKPKVKQNIDKIKRQIDEPEQK